MKIIDLLEGYYKSLDIDRQEGRYVPPSKPLTQPKENRNQVYNLELWYDTTGYMITTVAPTLEKAQSQALYRVKKYLKAHYPRYDVTGLRKDQVKIIEIKPEEVRFKKGRLLVI